MKKSGLPEGILWHKNPGLTAAGLKALDAKSTLSGASKASTLPRPKGETSEAKKNRKSAIKMERRERRIEKKANKLAFKLEKLQQEADVKNMRTVVKGIKLL